MNYKDKLELYGITEEYSMLLDSIEELEGEITPEIEEALAINEQDFSDKVQAFGQQVKILNSEIKLLKDERDAFIKKIKVKENAISSIKEVVMSALNLYGDTTKSGGKQFKSDKINMYTSNRKSIDCYTESLQDMDGYATTDLTVDIDYQGLQNLMHQLKEADIDFKVNGHRMKKKFFMDAVKSGVIYKAKYVIDNDGKEVMIADEGSESIDYREDLTDGKTIFTEIDVVDKTSLTIR